MADDILRQLETLTNIELEAVRQKAASLLSIGSTGVCTGATTTRGSTQTETDVDLVLFVIQKVLRDRGCGLMPLVMMRRSHSYTSFKQSVPELMQFIRKQFNGKGQRIEFIALLEMGVGLLFDWMVDYGIPTTHAALMNNIRKMPAHFNRAFPGYGRMGYLKLVLRREING